MKIALVLDDTLDKPDGVQQAVVTIGRWLDKEGHEVHYIVGDTKRSDLKHIHSFGRFVTLKLNKNIVRMLLPSNRKKIKALIKREDFDVIHVMMPYSPLMGKLTVQYAGPKTAVIGTFHTLPASKLVFNANHFLSYVLGKSLKRFDSVIALSEPVVHFARKAYGLNATYVPNPVVIDDFKSGRRIPAYDRKKLNIIFIGRLVQRKGVLELIRAYNALSDVVADKSRLIIGGKGPLKAKAKNLVNSNRNVTFTGFVSEKDKANFLASADIAVFPSTSGEAFGIVLIEAMAAGAGVVLGGNNPGYKSVLGQQPYLLFDPQDTKAFADHLQLFIEDPKLRGRMNSWQSIAIQQYDISVVGKTLMRIYKECLHSRLDVG